MESLAQVNANRRSGKIDFLRFFFALCILVTHFRYISNEYCAGSLLQYSALATEFFFVLSGFLLGRELDKTEPGSNENIARSTWLYLVRKIKRFLPCYVISFILAFACYCLFKNKCSVPDIVSTAVQSIPSFLLLKSAGWTHYLPDPVGTAWYLSAVVLSSAILYPVCKKSRSYFKIGTAVTGLFLVGMISIRFESLVSPNALIANCLYKGTVRGFGEMCLGIASYNFYRVLLANRKMSVCGKVVFSVIELLSFALSIYLIVFSKKGTDNIFALIASIILVILAYDGQTFCSSWFNRKLFFYLGRLSLSLYLSHYLLNYLDKYLIGIWSTGFYAKYRLIIVYLSAIALAVMVDFCSQKLKGFRPLQALFVKKPESGNE